MTVRHNALLNSYTFSGAGTFDQNQEMPRNLIDSLTVITVESISGAPTTATISPKFWLWHSMVGGNQEEANTGGAGLSPDKSWLRIVTAQNPSLLPDGDWPTALDVSAASLTAPVMVARSLKGGFPWKLSVDVAFTGGAAPSLRLSVMTYFNERPGMGFDRVESST